MATKRLRSSGNWEFIVRRKGVLPKPATFTFANEAEGDAYCLRLESLLDRGIVPDDLLEQKPHLATIADAIRGYLIAIDVSAADRPVLGVLLDRVGGVTLAAVDYAWVESWVRSMKQTQQLAPSSIRHYVGALARCLDWVTRSAGSVFIANPLRQLPRRYANYTPSDAAVLRGDDHKAVIPSDISRDRRLDPGEEAAIRAMLAGATPEGRERPLALKWQGALECLFDLALETAMRLREIYTLELSQIDLEKRTIFLDKTKNGDKRQVPLSSVALAVLARYREQVEAGTRGMAGFSLSRGRLFPWLTNTDAAGLRRITSLLSAQFSRVFEVSGCADLKFHDLRHEATSRLFERTPMSDLQIAKVTGHRDPRMLARYANLRGSDLADLMW